MRGISLGSLGRREELILVFILLCIATLVFVLLTQAQVIYYLIGAGILAILLWAQLNLRRWIYLTFIFIPFSPAVVSVKFKLNVSAELADFFVATTILIFLSNLLINPRMRRKNDYYLLFPFALYVLVCALGSLFGFYFHLKPILILNSLGHLLKWAGYVFIYFIVFRVFRNENDFKNLLRIILVSFGLGAMVTVYRYLAYSGQMETIYRARGMMEGLNGYAVILALILAFYFNLIMQGKSRELFPLWLMLSLWGLICLALITTFSRSGWVTLWGSLIIISFLRRRRYIAVILIGAALANFFLLRNPVERRIKMTLEREESSAIPFDLGGRSKIWRATLNSIGKRYFLGVGYFNFGQVVYATTPHNQYLQILAESGLFGLLAFLYFVYRIARRQLYLALHHPIPFFRECAFGNLVGIGALLVISIVGEFFGMAPEMAILLSFHGASVVTFMDYSKKVKAKILSPAPFKMMTAEFQQR